MALNQLVNGEVSGRYDSTKTFNDMESKTKLQVRLMDPKAYQMRANYAAFIVYLKLLGMRGSAKNAGRKGFATGSKTVNCWNPEFEWYDIDVGDPKTTVAANVSANATSLTVATGTGVMFKAGDIAFIPSTSELIRITAVSGDTLTAGSVSDTATTVGNIKNAITSGATIIMVASAFGEGAYAAQPIHYNQELHRNYCQIFKKSTKSSLTNEATKYYGNVNRLAEQKKILFDQFLLEKERAFLLGRKSRILDNITSGYGARDDSQVVRTTDGLESFIATNRFVSLKSTFSYVKFMEFIKNIYEYGGDERLFICNPAMMLKIQEVLKGDAQTHIEISPKTKEFGIDIRRILTFAGSMDLLIDRTMGEIYTNPVGFALETNCLEEMVLRADKWEENIQQPGWDFRMDQIVGESGLKVTLEKRHGRIELVDSITDSDSDGKADGSMGPATTQANPWSTDTDKIL